MSRLLTVGPRAPTGIMEPKGNIDDKVTTTRVRAGSSKSNDRLEDIKSGDILYKSRTDQAAEEERESSHRSGKKRRVTYEGPYGEYVPSHAYNAFSYN